MSCQYKLRAAHLKLTPNDPKEKQGKKNCDQTQEEATQYTLMFKEVVLPWNSFTAQERSTQHTPDTQRHDETPGRGVVRKFKQKQKKRVDFFDSGNEEEAAAQLSYLWYR